jgi:glycine cleavage system H protein
MAFEYPENLRYLDTHEYAHLDGNTATIGITAFAVDQLGDIVFLELPDKGARVEKGEKFGTVESVKAVEDLKSPVTGTVVECNAPLIDAPEQLGEDPYGEGWLIKVLVENVADLDSALSAGAYQQLVEGE